ncbi:rhodanese-like domain-containing protein [Anaerobacillus isosaccharinicus]|uniref:Rhodanese-like domain-containing protein n=1 Tax=Anaerobacillus isosaccharinicus TaxID=1532552 RepID=A0A7S7RAR0_9BACI|nr:rhodanese-like domain-containing protein [Anaerobacillus isosaccharinicus]MBA5586630.1 rhodanese-like domain-containing protein [Anaerobacillus isosaccharinicus]QOY35136.1 rhodanese-like domain-containing protein [Anaerobacillus isosaccharinicus]
MPIRMISAAELREKLKKEENVFLLDVRAKEKFSQFHIEDPRLEVRNIVKTEIFKAEASTEDKIQFLPDDKEVIVTCTTGNSATKCAKILADKDYNVVVLEGGITAWKKLIKENE